VYLLEWNIVLLLIFSQILCQISIFDMIIIYFLGHESYVSILHILNCLYSIALNILSQFRYVYSIPPCNLLAGFMLFKGPNGI